MKIIAMRTGENAKVDELGGGLKDMQDFVGGYIEAVSLAGENGRNIILWCNEDGKMTHGPNRIVKTDRFHDIIHGPCFIGVVDSEGNDTGLTEHEVAQWLPVASGWRRRDAQ